MNIPYAVQATMRSLEMIVAAEAAGATPIGIIVRADVWERIKRFNEEGGEYEVEPTLWRLPVTVSDSIQPNFVLEYKTTQKETLPWESP